MYQIGTHCFFLNHVFFIASTSIFQKEEIPHLQKLLKLNKKFTNLMIRHFKQYIRMIIRHKKMLLMG